MKRILLAGETFTLAQTAIAGATLGHGATYVNGAEFFLAALREGDFAVEQLPSERCEREFPRSLETLQTFDAIVLSDISALTLLFTPESRGGNPSVDRLRLLVHYVAKGGGLMMAGGYTSFQGMFGNGLYSGTALEDCLPVRCLPYADGLEVPEGLFGRARTDHPILSGLPDPLPPVLGLNRVTAQEDAQVLLDVDHRGKIWPLLALRSFGRGRSLAFMSDIGPHWMSRPFLASRDYGRLMRQMLGWLTQGD